MNIHHLLQRQRVPSILGIALLLGTGAIALAANSPNISSDVASTRHNLSVTNAITAAPGSSFGTTVKASSETQICVFCHTPHAATAGVSPLWNRAVNTTSTYTFYDSQSLDANPKPGSAGVGAGSKLCLSCHDGTLAVGTVSVLNNTQDPIIAMQGLDIDKIPDSTSPNTGFTRRIGTDLSNDHPISFAYNAAVAAADGELHEPGASGVAVANRVAGQAKPQFPLINNQLECITCHDPHLKSDLTDPITGEPINNKFLRGNRFQLESPSPTGGYDPNKDIICLACHNKPTWSTSTHSNLVATTETYKDSAADLRDFPRGIATWQAACANCHDVHTVPGSRRLLREAVGSAGTFNAPKTGTPGSNAALEEVCYQCHSPAGDRILVQDTPDQVPDVKTDFSLRYHMPIVSAEQGEVTVYNGTTEVHDIGEQPTGPDNVDTILTKRGIDFLETRSNMGAGLNFGNRHAECTDCHQPHRVTRTELFNGDPTIAAITGTHRHGGSTDPGGIPHSNLASGSQRGQYGVEPRYSADASFYNEPIGFDEKRGAVKSTDPLPANESDVSQSYLTREYQVCAKCHSNYAFGDMPPPPISTIATPSNIPPLGRNGGTPSGTNGMRFYTNIFREIQAPAHHRGNAVTTDSGAHKGMTPYDGANAYAVDFTIRNRRSWHPVMRSTGRTPALRAADKNNWLWPWSEDIGNLTMYCTDCHGSNTAAGTVVPVGGVDGAPWGPHGSTNIFLLKGWWSSCTGAAPIGPCETDANGFSPSAPSNASVGAIRNDDINANDLCFKCHDYQVYVNGQTNPGGSGFGQFAGDNLHSRHNGFDGFRCMYCHVAIVHGWKNKAFLVNLNDVGPEANCRPEDWDDMPPGFKCNPTRPLSTDKIPMPPGTQVHVEDANQPAFTGGTWVGRPYTNPPYYRGSLLKVAVFAASGLWAPQNCGAVGPPSIELAGPATCGGWMAGAEGCSGVP